MFLFQRIQDLDVLSVTGTVTVSPWNLVALKVRNPPLFVVGRYFPPLSPLDLVGKPSFVVEEDELEVVGRILPPSSVEDEDELGVGKPSFVVGKLRPSLAVMRRFPLDTGSWLGA